MLGLFASKIQKQVIQASPPSYTVDKVVWERMFHLDKSRQSSSYLHGAVILAVAVAIVRILGALFRIPLGRMLEDTGMSTFTVASNIYAVLLTLSTAGLPVALSKMISASAALECPEQVRRVFSVGRNAFVLIGALSFFVMATFSEQLAHFFGSPTAATAILILSPAMLFVCLISAYRGYCQGFSIMMPTSVSQIIEAAARFAIGLGAAWYLSTRGFSSEITVAGAISGVTVGSLIACVYLFFKKRSIEQGIRFVRPSQKMDSRPVICKNLLRIAVPLTIGASIFSLINLFDTAIIMHRLRAFFEMSYQSAGYTMDEAVRLAYLQAQSLHGTYAMTLPLMNLPSSFVIPITVALIPAISGFLAKGDKRSAHQTAASGMRITSLLALPAAVGLAVLATPIMHLLYADGFAVHGGGLMAMMGLSAFFLCFFQVTNCVLQAYGYERYTVYTLTIGGLFKMALTWILLADPDISIYGAAIATLASYVLICVMNMVLVKWRVPNAPSFLRILTKPVICTAVMGATAWAAYGLVSSLISGFGGMASAISLMAAILLAMVVYLILVVALGAITREDMEMLPRGGKLAKFLRVRS